MQAVSQSYSSQAYASIQNVFSPSGSRTLPGQNPGSETPSSQTSAEEKISLSQEGKELSRNRTVQGTGDAKGAVQKDADQTAKQPALSEADLKAVIELKRRDTEVRTHEQAHLAAAGQYAAGGASFSYTTGPDGKRYASGGSVPIDLGKEQTPQATLQKMRTVKRAALAPANPSGADRNIAAQASAKEIQAMKEIQTEAKIEAPSSISATKSEDIDQTTNPRAEASRGNTKASETQAAPVAEFSRQSMTSAYQAVAALTP